MYISFQCCEKLHSKFSATAKELSNSKAFFRVLCFRAEAVSANIMFVFSDGM